MPNPARSCLAALLLAMLLPRAAAPNAAQHVIHISVDGLRAGLLDSLLTSDPSRYVHLERLFDEGSGTLNARTDYTHTNTLPNHVCMITARPVLKPPAQPNTVHHGYTSNDDPDPTETLHNTGNLNIPYKASVFDVVHDRGLSTALYASKSKFVLFDRSYDGANGAPDTTGPDNGRDKIDTYVAMSTGTPATAANLNAAFVTAMGASHFRFAFVHYVDLDAAGHATGWGSATWCSALQNVDGYVGAILGLVESDPVLAGHAVIILTADHGGRGTDHVDATDTSNYRVPFVVWGAGVAGGADLYALNPTTRLDPGAGRPDYDVVPPPIRNGDAGNLALALLGLPAIPGSTVNAGRDLRAALPDSVPLLWPWAAAVMAGALAIGGTTFIARRGRRTPGSGASAPA